MHLREKLGPAVLAALAVALAGAAVFLLLELRSEGPAPRNDPDAAPQPRAVRQPADAIAAPAQPVEADAATPEPAPAAGDELHVRRVPGGPPQRRRALLAVNEHLMGQRFAEARERALGVLAQDPDNDEMRQVVITTSCILSDPETARRYHAELPAALRDEMRRRCAAHGVELD